MANVVLDLIVEGNWVILKSDGHEIERTAFATQEMAIEAGTKLAEYAKKCLAEKRAPTL